MGQGDTPGERTTGVEGSAAATERGNEKARIEHEARSAVTIGMTLEEACPYPWRTPAADHFTAVFILAGGRV